MWLGPEILYKVSLEFYSQPEPSDRAQFGDYPCQYSAEIARIAPLSTSRLK